MNWKSASETSNLVLRVPLGLVMVMIGASAYRDFAPFVANITDGLGWVSSFGYVWAFILPALLIFGGALLAIGRYSYVAALTGGIALGSVPVGLILKNIITGVPLPDMMIASYPTIVWMVAFYLALNPMPDMSPPETEE
ncbi:MAG: hypothetical protein KBA40_02715 [Candidatus Peribacteraceae bacterium]|nr:hypothetical protein [Candidatus Peribacteraceae bacterium]MBP9851016.1 hypothetical protein [Candidatus Peribacteraceae bacterium]